MTTKSVAALPAALQQLTGERDVIEAARRVHRALGDTNRLDLVRRLAQGPATVSELIESTGLSPIFIGLIVVPIIGNVAEHFAAGAGVVDVPEGDQSAEEGVGPVFDRLRPGGGEERVGVRIKEKKGKLASEECREQALQPAKLKPAGGDGAFLVFDDARQPEEPDHRGVRVNFGGDSGRGSFSF